MGTPLIKTATMDAAYLTVAGHLNKKPVMDRTLRLVQYLCKFLTRFASGEEGVAFLNGLAANLSGTRLGMNLLKWLDFMIRAKKKALTPGGPDDGLEWACSLVNTTCLSITLLRMDAMWLHSRSLIKLDMPSFKHTTFKIWLVASASAVAATLLQQTRMRGELRKLETRRKDLVKRRRQKENVDKDMEMVFADKASLEKALSNSFFATLRNLSDMPIGYNLSGLGTLDTSVVGFFGTISSALALKAMVLS